MTVPKLTRKLVLETPERVADGAGGYQTSWTVLGTLWASVRVASGRDGETAGLTTAQMAMRITVRAAPPGAPSRPRPGQRFREGERVYRVLAVAEADPGARYLVCFAREEVAA